MIGHRYHHLWRIRNAIAQNLFWMTARIDRLAHRIVVWDCDECGHMRTDVVYRDSVQRMCDTCNDRWRYS